MMPLPVEFEYQAAADDDDHLLRVAVDVGIACGTAGREFGGVNLDILQRFLREQVLGTEV